MKKYNVYDSAGDLFTIDADAYECDDSMSKVRFLTRPPEGGANVTVAIFHKPQAIMSANYSINSKYIKLN